MTYSVGSVQINNGFSGQFYFPYSIGLIEVYFLKHSRNPNRYCFEPTIYKRASLSETVSQLIDRDVVLFSVYVWNVNISIAIARELKRQKEGIFIMFGGPSVPDLAEDFLLSTTCNNVACHQEGERTLTSILDELPHDGWKNVPGISYLEKNGEFRNNLSLPRMRDITQIPSPYLQGIFDRLIEANPKEQWLVSWETNR